MSVLRFETGSSGNIILGKVQIRQEINGLGCSARYCLVIYFLCVLVNCLSMSHCSAAYTTLAAVMTPPDDCSAAWHHNEFWVLDDSYLGRSSKQWKYCNLIIPRTRALRHSWSLEASSTCPLSGHQHFSKTWSGNEAAQFSFKVKIFVNVHSLGRPWKPIDCHWHCLISQNRCFTAFLIRPKMILTS